MPTETRIYRVIENSDGAPADAIFHLVRAQSPAQAIRHLVARRYAADVASQDDLVTLLSQGTKVREATV